MTLLLLLVCVSCTVVAERELSFDHHRKPSRYSGHFRINVGNHEDMTLISGHQKQRIQIDGPHGLEVMAEGSKGSYLTFENAQIHIPEDMPLQISVNADGTEAFSGVQAELSKHELATSVSAEQSAQTGRKAQ